MLASADGPVSIVITHVWITGLKGHHGEIAGRHMVGPGSGVLALMDWEGSAAWAFF